MNNSLFQAYMDRYIPMMENRYEYTAKKITNDCVVFHDEMDGSRVEVIIVDREKTAYMNQHHNRRTCVIKENDQDLNVITEIEGEILFISCSQHGNLFQYTYRKWDEENMMVVNLSERAVLDRIFDVFQESIENDPAYRLLFVTGQMTFYHY